MGAQCKGFRSQAHNLGGRQLNFHSHCVEAWRPRVHTHMDTDTGIKRHGDAPPRQRLSPPPFLTDWAQTTCVRKKYVGSAMRWRTPRGHALVGCDCRPDPYARVPSACYRQSLEYRAFELKVLIQCAEKSIMVRARCRHDAGPRLNSTHIWARIRIAALLASDLARQLSSRPTFGRNFDEL